MQGIVTRQLTSQPKEWFFKVVVGLGRDIIVLQILLTVKGDLLGLDLTVFDFYLISRKDNRNVFAHTRQVAVPVGYIFIGDTTSDIKHDNGTLSLDVISITETTKLFLPRRVPNVEFNGSTIRVKHQGVNLHTQRRHVLLFEFSRQVALDECSLSNTTVSDEDQFKFRHRLLGLNEKRNGSYQKNISNANQSVTIMPTIITRKLFCVESRNKKER